MESVVFAQRPRQIPLCRQDVSQLGTGVHFAQLVTKFMK